MFADHVRALCQFSVPLVVLFRNRNPGRSKGTVRFINWWVRGLAEYCQNCTYSIRSSPRNISQSRHKSRRCFYTHALCTALPPTTASTAPSADMINSRQKRPAEASSSHYSIPGIIRIDALNWMKRPQDSSSNNNNTNQSLRLKLCCRTMNCWIVRQCRRKKMWGKMGILNELCLSNPQPEKPNFVKCSASATTVLSVYSSFHITFNKSWTVRLRVSKSNSSRCSLNNIYVTHIITLQSIYERVSF